jgi:hypothetical protein
MLPIHDNKAAEEHPNSPFPMKATNKQQKQMKIELTHNKPDKHKPLLYKQTQKERQIPVY